jgi:hypothetical protein
MPGRLLQRQPALVARLRVDIGATGPLQPASAALERRTLRVGVALTLTLAALQSIAHLIDVVAFDLRFAMINADSDSSAFAWMSSVTTFGAALLLCLLSIVRPTRAWPLVPLAGAVAFMSLDDMVGLHERVSSLQTTAGPIEHFARIFWPLVFMPLLAATFVGLFAVAAGLRTGRRVRCLWGWPCSWWRLRSRWLLFALGSDHGELAYELEVALEEGAELAGWTDRLNGRMKAAASPSSARAAMSCPGEVAYAQASEPGPKRARAASRSRLRPKRSPSSPAGSIIAPRYHLQYRRGEPSPADLGPECTVQVDGSGAARMADAGGAGLRCRVAGRVVG